MSVPSGENTLIDAATGAPFPAVPAHTLLGNSQTLGGAESSLNGIVFRRTNFRRTTSSVTGAQVQEQGRPPLDDAVPARRFSEGAVHKHDGWSRPESLLSPCP